MMEDGGRSPIELATYFQTMTPFWSTTNVDGVATLSPKRLNTLYASGTSVERIIQDWERYADLLHDITCPLKVVDADRDHLGVECLYVRVYVRQLHELCSAERSPERPIEDDDDALFASQRLKGKLGPGGRCQHESGRSVSDVGSDHSARLSSGSTVGGAVSVGVSTGVAVAVFSTWVGVKVAAGSAVGVLVAAAVCSTWVGVKVAAGSAVSVTVGDGGSGVGSGDGVAAAAARVLRTAADRPEAVAESSDSSTQAATTVKPGQQTRTLWLLGSLFKFTRWWHAG